MNNFRGKAQAGFNFDEITVDNFCGGGGASTGIEAAIGRPVDIAINHDIDAIRMHEVNHPHTHHYCESVWDVDPREVAGGRPIGVAWFSPDCKHFSKARGSTPVSKNIRGLAWVALRWAATVKPRIIMLENVEEFKTWGPVRVGDPASIHHCAGSSARHDKIDIGQWWTLPLCWHHHQGPHGIHGDMPAIIGEARKHIEKAFFADSVQQCPGSPVPAEVLRAIAGYTR